MCPQGPSGCSTDHISALGEVRHNFSAKGILDVTKERHSTGDEWIRHVQAGEWQRMLDGKKSNSSYTCKTLLDANDKVFQPNEKRLSYSGRCVWRGWTCFAPWFEGLSPIGGIYGRRPRPLFWCGIGDRMEKERICLDSAWAWLERIRMAEDSPYEIAAVENEKLSWKRWNRRMIVAWRWRWRVRKRFVGGFCLSSFILK